MAMDNFREEIAVRRNSGLYSVFYVLCWIMLIISGLFAMISLSMVMQMFTTGFALGPIITLVVFGGMAFLLWRNKDELKTEYEYSFTNGDLDVSKVLNNSRRKYLTSLPMKSVEACGPVNTPAFQRYLSMKDVKKHNWFLNRDAKLYYFYFTKNSVKHLIVVELSDEMIELVRKPNYLPYGLWQE